MMAANLSVPASEPLPTEYDRAVSRDVRLAARPSLRYYSEVESTNDLALVLAGQGAPAGTAILAEAQRAGRGRRGREWFSPPGGNLYLSMVLRPAAANVSVLTLAAGVGAARAIAEATALTVELKWPNDLVIGRPWRKLGGLLCEAVSTGQRIDAVVVGIGINAGAMSFPPGLELRATSIEHELGRPCDRGLLTAALLVQVPAAIAAVEDAGAAAVVDEWRAWGRAALSGATVRWRTETVERRGRTRGVDHDGALLVECEGRTERIVTADMTWERVE